jgi:hypothetical protein
MGELLISANGKGHKTIATWWIAVIIVCGISAVIFYVYANKIDVGSAFTMMWHTIEKPTNNEAYNALIRFIALSTILTIPVVIVMCGIITGIFHTFDGTFVMIGYTIITGFAALFIILAPVIGYFMHMRISKTAIYIYENGINGSSVVPKFPLSFFLHRSCSSLKLADFQLTYDLISSVDVVNGNTLVINTSDVKHKVYAMNAKEIRDTIMAQKSKMGQRGV